MLTNIFPAVVFTAATTAPAAMSAASIAWSVLLFAGRHPFWVIFLITVPLLLFMAQATRRDAIRNAAINRAYAEWERTGQPQPGFGPGWAWSGYVAPETRTARQVTEETMASWSPQTTSLANGAPVGEVYPAALAVDEPVAARPFRPSEDKRTAVCQACRGALASKVLVYSDQVSFDVCEPCGSAGVEIADRHPVTTGGAA